MWLNCTNFDFNIDIYTLLVINLRESVYKSEETLTIILLNNVTASAY